jgi:hypothetical protein
VNEEKSQNGKSFQPFEPIERIEPLEHFLDTKARKRDFFDTKTRRFCLERETECE